MSTHKDYLYRKSGLIYSPSALVEPPRRPRPGNRDNTSNEVRRTSQHQSNSLVEPQSLNSRREEVLESIGAQVAMLHDYKQPDLRVLCSLEDARPGGRLSLVSDGIALGSLVSEGSFFWCQPPCCQRFVGQDEERG